MKKKGLRVAMLLLLAIGMILTVSCQKNPSENSTADPSQGEVGTSADGTALPFPKTNYKAELSIYYIDWGLYQDFFFSEDTSTDMNKAIYERADLVFDYLGVDILGFKGSAGGLTYASEISNQVLGGSDTHQIVLTHCYQGITTLVSNGCLKDFNEFDQISLDADYWNSELMESVEVQGRAFLGSSDFLIKDPNVIFFNKDILADYTQLEDPYKLVEDKKWTLDKMFQMAAQVDVVTEGTATEKTYGIVGKADWQAVAFADAADCNWLVDNGGYWELNMGPSNERYLNVFGQIEEAAGQNWFGLYGKTSAEELTINSCQALFSYESLQQAYKYKAKTDDSNGTEVDFGILPYPKYDVAQDGYRSLNWSGFMCVPTSVQNLEMVQKAMEALAFFSADTTIVAYYEKLLGARLADEPEDAKMLDVVFDGIVANPFFNFMQGSSVDTENLFYGISNMLVAKLANSTQVPSVSGLWNSYRETTQAHIDRYLN